MHQTTRPTAEPGQTGLDVTSRACARGVSRQPHDLS
jgi:hypothetical protein